jgi:hypothetical protein
VGNQDKYELGRVHASKAKLDGTRVLFFPSPSIRMVLKITERPSFSIYSSNRFKVYQAVLLAMELASFAL